ncbi:MAG: hypothetical protein ACMUIA_08095 [bacterium]
MMKKLQSSASIAIITTIFIGIVTFLNIHPGLAQTAAFPGGFRPQVSFFPLFSGFPIASYPRYTPLPFYSPLPFFLVPLTMPFIPLSQPRPHVASINFPQHLVRSAAATITIIFDPALSVVNVSAVPIGTLIPPVPVVPTVVAPTVVPTGLSLLSPLLAVPAATGPPYSFNPTATPTAKNTATALSGLTALLPLLTLI